MKFAFVFPGQGSQFVGMMNAWISYPTVKEILQEGSDVLKKDIIELISHGPMELLSQTINTQPIMFIVGIALYKLWTKECDAKPVILAGHSLGEYSALVASDAVDFSSALEIICFRATIMQNTVPNGMGSMAAILDLDYNTISQVCTSVSRKYCNIVEVVNFNSPTQFVIAGDKNAVEKVCQISKNAGAKRAILLPVSGPFHSSLLKPASEKLREYLTDKKFFSPKIDIINNVDAKITKDSNAIKDALARQISSPVRWTECIKNMEKIGVKFVIESSPKSVLSNLTRRIVPTLNSISLLDRKNLEKAISVIMENES